MKTTQKVKQMAHLKQKHISDSSCKSIIIDTLLDAAQPLTYHQLAADIKSMFHVLVTQERLESAIRSLQKDGIIVFDEKQHISITQLKQIEYSLKKQEEIKLQQNAVKIWLDSLNQYNINKEDKDALEKALPVFLRTLFVKHGVSSFELLTPTAPATSIDIKQIASDIAAQFDEERKNSIETYLPTIFQDIDEPEVCKYLKHSIEKAVGYISEVISDDAMKELTADLSSLTIYLDTNVLYRLLGLQGRFRFESIRETLEFCRKYNIKLRIGAQTRQELSSRLKFDAKVLTQFPVSVNLATVGYKYRTADNYVSTYWNKARKTRISVEDFISYYQNYDILLKQDNIEVEDVLVDEESLLEKARYFYGKLSLRDRGYQKNDASLWHDAYSLAYIRKMQRVDARNAIDARCLFLTTDQTLLSWQREDHELKETIPIAISPSQLLQIFSFTQPENGYEETFIKFFASSSMGISFQYDNNDIQEILSRIGHYKGTSADVAEKILARELLNSRYLHESSDEEKEEIIYQSVSEELLNQLGTTKEELETIRKEYEDLGANCQAAQDLMEENDARYRKETAKFAELVKEKEKEIERKSQNLSISQATIEEMKRKNKKQEELFVQEKLKHWMKNRRKTLWIGVVLTALIIVGTFYLWLKEKDSGVFGILTLLCASLPIVGHGYKYKSDAAIHEQEKIIKEEYEKNL